MALDYKTVKADLIAKGLADEELVAFGQNVSAWAYLGGAIGGAIAGATAKKHAITKHGDKIAVIPFNNKEILYGEAYEIDKSKIQKAKVGF